MNFLSNIGNFFGSVYSKIFRPKNGANKEDSLNTTNDVNESETPQIVAYNKIEPLWGDAHYSGKYKAKHRGKGNIGKRFIVGQKYLLKLKLKDTSGKLEFVFSKKYECVKFIHSINSSVVNYVVMKAPHDDNANITPLTKDYCKMLHIKYEPNLLIFPMDMDWIPEKEYNKFMYHIRTKKRKIKNN